MSRETELARLAAGGFILKESETEKLGAYAMHLERGLEEIIRFGRWQSEPNGTDAQRVVAIAKETLYNHS